jgi:hypothetical protein
VAALADSERAARKRVMISDRMGLPFSESLLLIVFGYFVKGYWVFACRQCISARSRLGVLSRTGYAKSIAPAI